MLLTLKVWSQMGWNTQGPGQSKSQGQDGSKIALMIMVFNLRMTTMSLVIKQAQVDTMVICLMGDQVTLLQSMEKGGLWRPINLGVKDVGWFCFSELCYFLRGSVSMNPKTFRAGLGGSCRALQPSLSAPQCPLVAGSLWIGPWLLASTVEGMQVSLVCFLGNFVSVALWVRRAGTGTHGWDRQSWLLTCGISLQFPVVLRLKRSGSMGEVTLEFWYIVDLHFIK